MILTPLYIAVTKGSTIAMKVASLQEGEKGNLLSGFLPSFLALFIAQRD